jgi:NADH dehydrogenase [ubiquinone] 1 alpha subcomplex assembly factor 6
VRDEKTDIVASDVGVGLGILTALRSTGFRATQAECSIPLDLANKHSVSMDALWSAWEASSGSNDDGDDLGETEKRVASRLALRGAVVEMADLARSHLHRARDNQSGVPKEGRAALLPAVCGLHYLDTLEGCDYDVLHPSLVGARRVRGDDGDDDNASSGSGRRRRLGLMFSLGRTWLSGTF